MQEAGSDDSPGRRCMDGGGRGWRRSRMVPSRSMCKAEPRECVGTGGWGERDKFGVTWSLAASELCSKVPFLPARSDLRG